MSRHLHTAVSDEIRRNAFDAENVKERQMESEEYRNEVMGRYDYDDDPADRDDDEGPEDEGGE